MPVQHARTAPSARPGPLLDLVREVAADPAQWQGAVRFDATQRCWAHLRRTDDVDLWLLTWLPGQQTELHDHGDAAAAFTVLSGAVAEVRAQPDGSTSRAVLTPGDSVWVPPGAVHDVLDAGNGPAVSLHAYSPRLTRMTYDVAGRRGLRAVRTVLGDEPEHAG